MFTLGFMGEVIQGLGRTVEIRTFTMHEAVGESGKL